MKWPCHFLQPVYASVTGSTEVSHSVSAWRSNIILVISANACNRRGSAGGPCCRSYSTPLQIAVILSRSVRELSCNFKPTRSPRCSSMVHSCSISASTKRTQGQFKVVTRRLWARMYHRHQAKPCALKLFDPSVIQPLSLRGNNSVQLCSFQRSVFLCATADWLWAFEHFFNKYET